MTFHSLSLLPIVQKLRLVKLIFPYNLLSYAIIKQFRTVLLLKYDLNRAENFFESKISCYSLL